jgi:hypothetical protein
MTNLPYGLMEALVADHQRELHQMASRWRLRRRRGGRNFPVPANLPGEGRASRDLSPNIAVEPAA